MATPDPRGLEVARRFAGYHLGDPLWANEIVRAYLDPEAVAAELDAAQGVTTRA